MKYETEFNTIISYFISFRVVSKATAKNECTALTKLRESFGFSGHGELS